MRHIHRTTGAVFQAYQDEHDRPVALKVINSKLTADKDGIKRFIRGALVATQLTHPNIVQHYDTGEIDGVYYIAMEFVEEPNLIDIMVTGGSQRSLSNASGSDRRVGGSGS